MFVVVAVEVDVEVGGVAGALVHAQVEQEGDGLRRLGFSAGEIKI